MTDNRTTELLPCPFCGGEAELKRYQSGDWQVICYHADGCIMLESDLDNCYWENVQTLARQWNTRAELGSDTKPCYATDENYKRCKYSVNRGWCDDAPFLVWDDAGHLFITMGGLKTWDVTDDAKKWIAELGNGTCEVVSSRFDEMMDEWCIELSCGHCVWDRTEPPNFCEECGAHIRKAVAR